MKIPVVCRYFSINMLVYLILISAITFLFLHLLLLLGDFIFSFGIFAIMLTILLLLVLVWRFLIPVYIIAIFAELILFKLKLINYENPVNVSKNTQIIFYLVTALLVVFCFFLLLHNDSMTAEQLRFD